MAVFGIRGKKDVSGDFFHQDETGDGTPRARSGLDHVRVVGDFEIDLLVRSRRLRFLLVIFRRFPFWYWNVPFATRGNVHHALPKLYNRAHGSVPVIGRVIRVSPMRD